MQHKIVTKYVEKENRRLSYPVERLNRTQAFGIYENLMADTLHKKTQNLYYFQKDSGLELDFLVRMNGECVPLEVKAKSSKAKSARTVLNHPEKYHVKQIIKFGDYNIGREGHLLTLPSYMQFLLNLQPEEIVLDY